ncbi:hypothetical protein BBJ28_00022723 [Nothophytophthora sp. Chile5]|nr:hypothetical protein BBJ28_00022723 [Nothophytophthora sp. Chile5]
MGIRAQHQYHHHQVQSLTAKFTASILSHPASHLPSLPGRPSVGPTRLPGIRALFCNWKSEAEALPQVTGDRLPSLQAVVASVSYGSPIGAQFTVAKTMVGSPSSPGMTNANPIGQGYSIVNASVVNLKTRRPLSLQDLLSAEVDTSISPKRNSNVHHRRQCGILDCHKYALTGGYCIRHGGGKRCSHDNCQTVAQSGGRCKAHGGGSKCKVPGCGSVARRKGFCMSHGGRQQCKLDGCSKCAHGGGFCIAHGGGKRCASKLCTKSAQAGGFCYSHGGGKRCAAPECFQAARKGGFCIRHRKAAQRMA